MAGGERSRGGKVIVAVSGGPDSVYLLHRALREYDEVVVAHVNHGARGERSEQDERFVRDLAQSLGLSVRVHRLRNLAGGGAGFEERARRARYAYFERLCREEGADAVLVGHTADDQVETVLMRILRGTGIAGLKGIPRRTEARVERPLLRTWRREIISCLEKRGIPYRVDESNADTRFERNWIRHVLLPALAARYGQAVTGRIFELGERLREVEDFVADAARRWVRRNTSGGGPPRIPRGRFARLPEILRKRILQLLCEERAGIRVAGRTLDAMDRLVVSRGPSARLDIGGGGILRNRYGSTVLEVETGSRARRTGVSARGGRHNAFHAGPVDGRTTLAGPGTYRVAGRGGRATGPPCGGVWILWEETIPPKEIPREVSADGERSAFFDAGALRTPLSVRPVRAGDRMVPFGLGAPKKVKEIFIDRKVPRDERWGRPALCDARGEILWIPGVVRSSHAPLTAATRRAALFTVSEADLPGRA